jgi:hypothetical protein
MEQVLGATNSVFSPLPTQIAIGVGLGVLLGYTARPMPKFMDDLFENSQPFKFIIIFLVGLVASVPLDGAKIITVAIVAVLILVAMEALRVYDCGLQEKKDDGITTYCQKRKDGKKTVIVDVPTVAAEIAVEAPEKTADAVADVVATAVAESFGSRRR